MRLQSGGAAGDLSPAPTVRSVRFAYLMMLASSVSFAAMSACAHAARDAGCDWRLPALARAALVLLLTAGLARARRVTLTFRGTRTLWLRSIMGSISMLFTFYALTHLHIATAVTLTNTTPLWVTLLAWPVLRQRPTPGVLLALSSGIAGVYLIEQPHEGDFRLASVAALAAALCTAVVMIGLHRLRHLDPLVIVVHFSAVATGVIGGFIAWSAATGRGLDVEALGRREPIALLMGIGLLGSIGQVLMTNAFRVAMPQRLSVVALAQVPLALAFELLLWEHAVDYLVLAGIALVVAPVAWLLARRGHGA